MSPDRTVDRPATIPPSLVAGRYGAVQIDASDEASAPTMYDLGVSCHRLGWPSSGRHGESDFSKMAAFPAWHRGWWSAELASEADHEAARLALVPPVVPGLQ